MLHRSLTIVVAMIILSMGSASTAAHAQEWSANPNSQSALAVSPAILEHVLTPGQPTSFTIEVRNITSFPLPIRSFVRGLTTEKHTTDLSEPELARLDASRWFTINEPDFILQANQARNVTGVINPPQDADPGGHYATIFFQPLIPAEALSQSTAYINARVGVLSFLVVKGEITKKAELKGGLQTDRLVQNGPVIFKFSVHNSGNVHLIPKGKVAIFNIFGKHVADVPVPSGAVLPGSSREYSMQWAAARPGKYRAELMLGYGSDGVQPPATVSFWVLPGAGYLIGFMLLAGFLLAVFKTRRRWRLAWQELRTKS